MRTIGEEGFLAGNSRDDISIQSSIKHNLLIDKLHFLSRLLCSHQKSAAQSSRLICSWHLVYCYFFTPTPRYQHFATTHQP